ncbi:phage tail protein [Nocardiopsis synnemataformans]|uniref:phage tail protein n=1 Tax=Nocardiopsis synnemataformans TaxID=61305 RepID=UPI003EBD177F
MAMNVGELVATLDVDDRGYSRGLVTAAAEAKTAATLIERNLDVDGKTIGTRTGAEITTALKTTLATTRVLGEGAGRDAGDGITTTVVRSLQQAKPAMGAAGEDAGEAVGDGITRGADDSLRSSRTTFVRSGEDAGGGFETGILGSFKKALPGIGSGGGGLGSAGAGGVMKGLAPLLTNVFVLVGVAALALWALPAIGATVGVALALAFGGGIAGVGLAAAAQADEVKDAFSELRDSVVSDLKRMAQPLEQTLVDVAGDLGSLFDSLSPHLESAFEDMAPVLSRFSEDLFGAFEGLGPVIDDASGAFEGLLDALGPDLEDALGGIWDALSGLFETIEENPDVFAGIITGALNLVAGIITLVDWLSQAYVWINEHVPGGLLGLLSPLVLITEAFRGAGEKGGEFSDSMSRMGEALSEAWEHIRSGAEDLWEAISPILEDLWEALASSDVLETVQEWWGQLAEILEVGGELLGELMSAAAEAITWIWENFGEEIIEFFGGLWTILEGMVEGGLESIEGIIETILGIITGDWERAWEGIKKIGSGIWTALTGIVLGAIETIWAGLKATLKLIGLVFSNAWEGLKRNASAAWNTIKSTITNLWNATLSTIRGKLSQWASIGAGIVSGIVSGVYGAAGQLYSTLRGIAAGALQAAKDALGINSPSKAMRDQVGRWIPEGISAGLDLGQSRLDRRVRKMADSMSLTLGAAAPLGAGADPRRPGDGPGGGGYAGAAVHIDRFEATERMSPHDVGEALWGLVTARGGV